MSFRQRPRSLGWSSNVNETLPSVVLVPLGVKVHVLSLLPAALLTTTVSRVDELMSKTDVSPSHVPVIDPSEKSHVA